VNLEERADILLRHQRNEITEHHIYRRLALRQEFGPNRQVLEGIAADEKRHYEQWKKRTGCDVPPDWGRVRLYCLLVRVFGLTFGLKLMERGELKAQLAYARLREEDPEVQPIMAEEHEHEQMLLGLLDEERLRYIGSVVLGLNDALVELTGALAGLTLALRNGKLIAMTGSITGIAAALSMAASEYLSTKTEGKGQHPVKAALYTGTTYLLTVIILVVPYLVLPNFYWALGCTLSLAIIIIAFFNYYVAVARDQPFAKRFFEMATLSLSVAAVSFVVGLLLQKLAGTEI